MVINALLLFGKPSIAFFHALLHTELHADCNQTLPSAYNTKRAMESNNRLVIIELNELEAMIERVVERKLREHLNQEIKSLGRNGRMSLKDVMAELGISKQTVYNWIKDDKLPKPARIGRRLYWSSDAIKAMMP